MYILLCSLAMLRISRSTGISPSAEGDQGLCPMEPTTFEKVDETFKLCYFLIVEQCSGKISLTCIGEQCNDRLTLILGTLCQLNCCPESRTR